MLTCLVCQKDFSTTHNLTRHRKNIHKIVKPKSAWVCSVTGCTKSYKHATNLSRHKKLVHNLTRHHTRQLTDMSALIGKKKVPMILLKRCDTVEDAAVQTGVKRKAEDILPGPSLKHIKVRFHHFYFSNFISILI